MNANFQVHKDQCKLIPTPKIKKRKTYEKPEADIGIEYIQFPHMINNIAQIEILL